MQRFQHARTRVALARDEGEIAVALQNLVDTLLPSETAEFSEEALAALTGDREDVPAAAVILKRSELLFNGSNEARSFLHELALVYEEATQRISQLHARRLQP